MVGRRGVRRGTEMGDEDAAAGDDDEGQRAAHVREAPTGGELLERRCDGYAVSRAVWREGVQRAGDLRDEPVVHIACVEEVVSRCVTEGGQKYSYT